MAKLKSGFLGERAIILPTSIIEELKNDTLGSLLHITDIGCYPKADFHFRKRSANEAQQYILIYCIDGEGWFELNSKRHLVEPDHFFILPKNVSHAYGCNSKNPWTIYWLHFDGEKAGFFSEGLDKPISVSPQKNSRIEDRLHMFEEIFATLKNGYSKNNLDYSIVSLFHFLGSFKFLGEYRESFFANQNLSDITDMAVHYMRENIHKSLTLKDLSEYVGFSASHFSSIFQKKNRIFSSELPYPPENSAGMPLS